jgi:hypothetical protein
MVGTATPPIKAAMEWVAEENRRCFAEELVSRRVVEVVEGDG